MVIDSKVMREQEREREKERDCFRISSLILFMSDKMERV